MPVVSEFGLTERDVFPSGRKSGGTRAGGKVAPKYRDPATGQTWTGRGHTEPLPARALLAFRLEADEWQGVRRVRLLVEGVAG